MEKLKNILMMLLKISSAKKLNYPVSLLLKHMQLRKLLMEMLSLYLDSKSKKKGKVFSIEMKLFSSSLIMRILETAVRRGIDFRVIIVDSRPQQHGKILLQRK